MFRRFFEQFSCGSSVQCSMSLSSMFSVGGVESTELGCQTNVDLGAKNVDTETIRPKPNIIPIKWSRGDRGQLTGTCGCQKSTTILHKSDDKAGNVNSCSAAAAAGWKSRAIDPDLHQNKMSLCWICWELELCFYLNVYSTVPATCGSHTWTYDNLVRKGQNTVLWAASTIWYSPVSWKCRCAKCKAAILALHRRSGPGSGAVAESPEIVWQVRGESDPSTTFHRVTQSWSRAAN